MEYTLTSGEVRAVVSTRGAELRSLQAHGAEYLWNGDAQYWAGRSPLLFPYVGRLTDGRYRLQGQTHEMDIHGFAKDGEFLLEDHQARSLTFLLRDDAGTFAHYPCHFELRVTYTLNGCHLSVAYNVKNRSEEEMYFGIGGHPGFRLPLEEGLAFSDYALTFRGPCQPDRVHFTEACFLAGGTQPLPLEGEERLPLRHSLFNEDAVVLVNMARTVELRADKGSRWLKMSYPDMPYLGLWHAPKTQAPYLCIEPWSSLPSRQDIVEEFACKSDLIRLPLDKTYQNGWAVELF